MKRAGIILYFIISVIVFGGIKGEYYNSIDLSGGVALERIDNEINFNWGSGSPSTINNDDFSVRWEGVLLTKNISGDYQFITTSDDGVKLWIKDSSTPLISNWTLHGTTDNTGTITLEANKEYYIKMEYYEHTGAAVAQLSWIPPGGTREIISASNLKEAFSDLVLDYRLIGDAKDSSGNNNNGIVSNAVLTQDRNNRNDSAYKFAGTNSSYISTSNSNSLNISSNITVASWVKWDINPQDGVLNNKIIDKSGQYSLGHNGDNSKFSFGLNGNKSIESSSIVNTNRWYFVVGTYDGSSLKIYVNGNLENQTNYSDPIITNTNSILTGKNFSGIIDEVKIYNLALNNTEILNMYNEEKPSYKGIKGKYFNNITLSGTPVLERIDNEINFNWGTGSPDTVVNNDDFSVRWEGVVKTKNIAGDYQFITTSDDGVKLWVKDSSTPLISNWSLHGSTDNTGTITLEANKEYYIKMEYYEHTGAAVAQLSWIPPSGTREIIPALNLAQAYSDLILDYEFIGDTNDSSGNNNTGIGYNITLTGNNSGKANEAYGFAGNVDSYIETADSGSLNPTDKISVMSWVKFDELPTIATYVTEKNGQYGIGYENGKLFFEINGTKLISNSNISAKKWYLVSGTYDGSSMDIYINNVRDNFVGKSGNINISSNKLITGKNLKGAIDNIKIYNKALTGQEIKDYYKETSPSYNCIKGEYFNNIDLNGTPALTRIDNEINFNWGTGSPDSLINNDDFSVRWEGFVKTKDIAGNYQFITTSDDGVRLWIKDSTNTLINNWTLHGTTDDTATINLEANKEYYIKMEYYENTGNAVAQLSWIPPGGTREIIPENYLYQQKSDLLLYYDFEDDSLGYVKDTTENGYDGIEKGDFSIVNSGKVGKCGYFDGNGDYLAIKALNFKNSADLENLSVAAWVKSDSKNRQIISSFDRSENWRLSLKDDMNNNIGWDTTSGNVTDDFGSSSDYTDGKWHFVVATYNKGNKKIYVDGNLVESKAGNETGLGSNTLRYGFVGTGSEANSEDGTTGPDYWFDGYIDEFRIYSKELSQSEINSLYLEGQDLVAEYKFDGGLTLDSSGFNNDGIINGGVVETENRDGDSGKALSFDGSTGYVEVDDSESLNPTKQLTLSAWIKWNIDPTTGENYAEILSKNGDDQYQLQHSSGNDKFEFAINTTSGRKYIQSTTSPVADKWYYVVGTYDGINMKLYVNGALETTTGYTGDLLTSNEKLDIGRRSVNNDRYFNGAIDDVKIYRKALTADEIGKNYVSKPDLLVYYDFDNEISGKVKDMSYNNNNGIIKGGFHTVDGGIDGKGGYFDGTGDYLSIDNLNFGNANGITDLTVMAWVKSSSENKQIISSFDRSENFRLSLKDDMNNNIGWDTSSLGTATDDFGYDKDYVDGNWHLVAATYSNGSKKIYVDGEKVAEKTGVHASKGIGTGADRYGFVGTGSEATTVDGATGPDYWFNGIMDDFKIYSRELSSSEISKIYTNGLKLIAHYKLDSDTNDYSGNNHNGTGTNISFDSNGEVDGAGVFNGVDSNILTDDFSVPETFSVVMWANPNSIDESGFISKTDLSGNNIFDFGYDNNGVFVKIRDSINSEGIKLKGWEHLAVVIKKIDANRSNVKVYRNSEILWEKDMNSVIGDSIGNGWKIGANSTNKYFNGELDDIRIYGKELSVDEITELYRAAGANENFTIYYPFTHNNPDSVTPDSTKDESNSGNDGILHNGVTIQDETKRVNLGKTAYFDGIDDYIEVPNTDSINTGVHDKRSISLWFKPEDLNSRQILYEEGGTVRGLNIYIYNGRLYFGGWNEPSNESNWKYSSISTDEIEVDKWYHAVLVLDGTDQLTSGAFKAYLNSRLLDEQEGSKLWPHPGLVGIGAENNGTKFHDIGDDGGSTKYFFKGYMDEIHTFNEAINQDKIDELYSVGLDVIAYYPFDDSTSNDKSGNGNNGTLYGGVRYEDGYFGKEALFNGIDGYINLTDFYVPPTFTVAMWVRPDETQTNQAFVSKSFTNGDNLFTAGYSTTGLYVDLNDKNIDFSSSGFKSREFQQFVVKVEKLTALSSKVTVYINGEKKSEENVSSAFNEVYGNSWILGKDINNNYFQGNMDDVKFYGRGLSDEEVADLYKEIHKDYKNRLEIYYPFERDTGDGKVKDESESGNDGVKHGNIIYEPGKQEQGARFDGASYVEVPNTEDLNTATISKRTVSLWFKTDDVTTKQVLYEEGGTVRGLNIYIENGKIYYGGWNEPTSESNWDYSFISADIVAGRWYNAVLVLDGTSNLENGAMKAYLNMELVGTAEGSKLWPHPGNIGVGAVNNGTKFHDSGDYRGTGLYYTGLLDEIRIYRDALSLEELQKIYGYQKIVINEVMWAGDEYIELRNKTPYDVDLEGWMINNAQYSQNSNPYIEIANAKGISGSSTTIPADGYLLIQNEDNSNITGWTIADNSVTSNEKVRVFVCADSNKMNLNNSGEQLILKDNNYITVDMVNIENSSWPKGKNEVGGISMERFQENTIPPGTASGDGTLDTSWYTFTGVTDSNIQKNLDKYGNIRKGTPGDSNSLLFKINSVSPINFTDKTLTATINIADYLYGQTEHEPKDYIDSIEFSIGNSEVYSKDNVIVPWEEIPSKGTDINKDLSSYTLEGNYYIYVREKKGTIYSDVYVSNSVYLNTIINITDVWDTLSGDNSKDYDVTSRSSGIYGMIKIDATSNVDSINYFEYKIYVKNSSGVESVVQNWVNNNKNLEISQGGIPLTNNYTYYIEVRADYGVNHKKTAPVRSDGIICKTEFGNINIYKNNSKTDEILESIWNNTGEPVDSKIYIEWIEDSYASSYEYGMKAGSKDSITISDGDFTGNTTATNLDDFNISEGVKTFFIRAVYPDGVKGQIKKFELKIDDTKPDITGMGLIDVRADLTSDVEWTNGETPEGATYTLKCMYNGATDSLSGVDHYEYGAWNRSENVTVFDWENRGVSTGVTTKSGLSLTEYDNTDNTIYIQKIRVYDKAGNYIDVETNGVKFDKTKPDVSGMNLIDVRADKTEDVEWTNGETPEGVTYTLKYNYKGALDNLSGVNHYEYGVWDSEGVVSNWENIGNTTGTGIKSALNLTEYDNTKPNELIYIQKMKVYDKAGNISDVVETNGVKLDITKPVISNIYLRDNDSDVYRTGETSGIYYGNSSNLKLNIAASDNLAGVGGMKYGLSGDLSSENYILYNSPTDFSLNLGNDGEKDIFVQVVDNAGNESVIKGSKSEFNNIFNYDNTVPVFNAINGNGDKLGYQEKEGSEIIIPLTSGTAIAYNYIFDSNDCDTSDKDIDVKLIFNPTENYIWKIIIANNSIEEIGEFNDSSGNLYKSVIWQNASGDYADTNPMEIKLYDKAGNYVEEDRVFIKILSGDINKKIIDAYIDIYGKKKHIYYIETSNGNFEKYYLDSDK
ncbi:LamG-like jellyroll fold domain-containing protein [Haliovirga abyssi]|uniref:PA14 domain-containing protein n=1 Tax=Haliovirga abyssi TaxID=2996794 RepID=A0AAU9DIQ3_9FUSO|nr:LamG-like jellyroll fold domain-containing protein [Haliovirga abyssi]BDU50639.1 hypothetical protein HLVA_12080 [Haliovirga abyssi]